MSCFHTLFFFPHLFQPQTLLFECGSASVVGSRLMLACVWWRLALWLNSCHDAAPPDLCWNSIRTPPCRCQSHIAMVTPVSEVSGKITEKWLVLMMVGLGGLYQSVACIFQLNVNTSNGFIIYFCVCMYASHLERDLLDNKQFGLRVCVSLHGLSVRRGCFSPSCLLLSLYLCIWWRLETFKELSEEKIKHWSSKGIKLSNSIFSLLTLI